MTQESIKRIVLEWYTNPSTTNASIAEINKLDAAFNKSIEGLGQLNNYQLDPLRAQFAQSSEALNVLIGNTQTAKGLLSNLYDPEEAAAQGFLDDLAKIQTVEQGLIDKENERLGLIQQQTDAMNQQAQQQAQAPIPFDSGANETGGGDGGGDSGDGAGGGSSISGVRSSLRALSGLLGPELGGGAARAAGQIATLTSGIGVFGIGVGAAIAVIRTITDAIDKEKQAELARLQVEQQVTDTVNQSTRQQLQDKIASAQEQLALDQQTNARLLEEQKSAQQKATDALNSYVHDFFTSIVVSQDTTPADAKGDLDAVNQSLDANKTALKNDQAQIDQFTAALSNNATQANDVIAEINQLATDAQKRRELSKSTDPTGAQDAISGFQDDLAVNAQQIADATSAIAVAKSQNNAVDQALYNIEKNALEQKGREIQSNIDLYQSVLPVIEANAARKKSEDDALAHANLIASAELEADKLTSDQRAQRVAELNREIEAYKQASQATDLSVAGFNELQGKIHGLEETRDIIGSVADSFADMQQRAQNLKDQTDKLLEAEKLQGDAEEKLTKAKQDQIDAENDHEDKLTAIRDQADTKEQADATKRDADIDDARKKSATKLSADLETIETNSDKRIKQLKEQGLLTIEKLIANNDQAAAIDALEAQALQIKQEKENTADAETAKKKEIADSLDQQVETIKQRYADQVTAAEAAAKQSIATENARYNKESLDRQRAVAEAERDAQNAANAVNTIQKNMASQGVFTEQYWANTRLSIVESNLQRIAALFTSHLSSIGAGFSGGSTGSAPLSNAANQLGQLLGSLINPSGFAQSTADLNAFYANYHGQTSAHAFDDGGTVTKPGFGWLGVVGERYSLPWAEKTPNSSGGGGNTYTEINVYPSPGMDEAQLARLVAQQIDRKTPAIINQASNGMAKAQTRATREARRGG